ALRIVEHDLAVRLVPAAHAIRCEDRITVLAGPGAETDLVLDPALVLEGPALVDGKPVELAREGARLKGWRPPPGRSVLTLRYGGVVKDDVQSSGDLAWVAGDRTRGLVDPKGVYLSGASRWVPAPVGRSALALFHVTAWIPAPYLVVTQGGVPERSARLGAGEPLAGAGVEPPTPGEDAPDALTTWNVLEARASVPSDDLTLVAGPYVTKSRVQGGVTLSTFFYEQDAAIQDLWLAAAASIVARYEPILGPYPHPKFDIVANFFSTGYGMPSFTLLGDEVIRSATARAQAMGGAIPPGYLDHEYVHGWYGNGLFVDYAPGNWCEGITPYCSNYLAKELEGPEAARAHRRGTLEKWSMRVKGAKDVPVRTFLQKVEDTDNDIGYGKSSMLFHLARRQMGDAAFWACVKAFTQARVGTIVGWDDWLRAFDEAAGTSVSAHVRPYLERPGAPEALIESVATREVPGGVEASVRLRQGVPAGSEPWPFFVPVRLLGAPDDRSEHEVDLSSGEATLTVTLPSKPTAVQVDPEWHALRRIAEADLPACLERTLLAAEGVVQVLGGEKEFGPLAQQVAKARGWRVVGPELDLAGWPGGALVLRIAPEGQRTLEAGGTTYGDPAHALLESRMEGGRARTVFTALSPAAAARAGRLPFYGWDPWVVFQGGRPVARDPRTQEVPSTQARFSVLLDAGAPPEPVARIKADLERLAGPELEGRWPGSKGHEVARTWLKERLKAWSGQEAWSLPFQLGRWRLESRRDLTIVHEDGRKEVLADAFRPLVAGAERQLATPESFEIVPWDDPDILALAQDANKRLMQLVVYVLTPRAEAGLAPWLDSEQALTPTAEAELAKPGRDGKPRPRPVLPTWLLGRRARLAPGLAPIPRTVVAVDEATGQRLKAAWDADARLALEVRWNAPVRAENVLGLAGPLAPRREMMDPRPKPPVVVLCAHLDSFGQQGEAFWPGADDNASGVACVLEVLAQLPAEAVRGSDSAPGLVVLLSDAEEWGLRGARLAADELAARYDVRAVLNVDTVGRAKSKPTFLVGLGTHPALAARLRSALEGAGVALGGDIDARAYAHGADHWPFHELGVPAVTVWASDYAVMNSASDTLEKVEPEGIATLAGVLARLLREDLAGVAAAR
ncbi:MAG: M28 family peptidase, partial [Planctomycetia bacterium]